MEGTHVSEIIANMEGQDVKVRAEFKTSDPADQQRIDDDCLIPNPGDKRIMLQRGRMIASDGETIIPVDLTFIRKRTETGGVSVVCQIPPLGLVGETEF